VKTLACEQRGGEKKGESQTQKPLIGRGEGRKRGRGGEGMSSDERSEQQREVRNGPPLSPPLGGGEGAPQMPLIRKRYPPLEDRQALTGGINSVGLFESFGNLPS